MRQRRGSRLRLFCIARAEVLRKKNQRFERQAFARFRRPESMDIVDGHKLHGNSGLLQFVGEFLRLRHGHLRVFSSVDDKERGIISVDMKCGRCLLPDFRMLPWIT